MPKLIKDYSSHKVSLIKSKSLFYKKLTFKNKRNNYFLKIYKIMPVFSFWNRCNSNCVMCTNYFGYRKKEHSNLHTKKRILKRINEKKELLKKNSAEIIQLTGGEPTIHPDFFSILYEIRINFPENPIVIITNGRRFTYNSFAKKVLQIRNLRFQIAIHGPNKKKHDRITRTEGSFSQTVSGLKNIFKYKNKSQIVEIRHILLRQNYKELDSTYKFINKNFPQAERMVTIFPEYKGRAKKNIKFIGFKYSDVNYLIEEVASKWGSRFNSFYLYNFPLCVVNPSYWKYIKKSLPRKDVIFKKECSQCTYKEQCSGIHRDYKNNFGLEEFQVI